MAPYPGKTSKINAIAGMLAGSIVMLVWYFTDMSQYMYEILPGFIAGLVVMIIMNQIAPEKDEQIIAEYDAVVKDLKQPEEA